MITAFAAGLHSFSVSALCQWMCQKYLSQSYCRRLYVTGYLCGL